MHAAHSKTPMIRISLAISSRPHVHRQLVSKRTPPVSVARRLAAALHFAVLWSVSLMGIGHRPAIGDDTQQENGAGPVVRHDRHISSEGGLFRSSYSIVDPSFCHASVCVDTDNDGRRELFFASRRTQRLTRLDAADGTVLWSKRLAGDQQSISAFDLNQDGDYEILYTVSNPGKLYVIDTQGAVVRQWDSGDRKLGNSAVILDSDGDGVLDGYLGSRYRYLLRLNMQQVELLSRRDGWSQCGCHTTAMDVDNDGRWDLFAGSGDDFRAKGVLHRFDPVSLKSLWTFETNDNASSADPVLVDLDGDGRVEIIKSVDNYKGDDAHDALYALTTDGKLLWKVPGIAQEDSPNVADLDGDGRVEIIGMTFGGEVYCLDWQGQLRWRKDLRPEHDNAAHAYMTPILCDLNGDSSLEILAMTNGSIFSPQRPAQDTSNGILFALSSTGEILDQLDLRGPRYFGEAFVCNLDDDPFLELVLSGSGGMDVIETRGFGPNTEHFQRRRTYQRLNVLPWAYHDTYFIHRGSKHQVTNLTDNLVLQKTAGSYLRRGRFVTPLLTLPPGCEFQRLQYAIESPPETALTVRILDAEKGQIAKNLQADSVLSVRKPVRLEFTWSTNDPSRTPRLDWYDLAFGKVNSN